MLEELKKGKGPIRIIAPDAKNRITPVFGAAPFNESRNGFEVLGEYYPAKLEKDDKGRGEHRMVSLGQHEIREDANGNIGKAAPVQIDNFSSYSFSHNDHYGRNDAELFMLMIGIENGYIATSKEKFNPLYNRFYIDDAEAESKVKAGRADMVYDAMTALRDMTQKDQASLAFVLQKPVLKMSVDMIEASLKEVATESPKKILDLVANADYKYNVFLQKLIAFGMISLRDGKYFDGSNCIGVDNDNALAYLKDKNNQNFIDQWHRMIKEKELGNVAYAASATEPTSVIDEVESEESNEEPKTEDS